MAPTYRDYDPIQQVNTTCVKKLNRSDINTTETSTLGLSGSHRGASLPYLRRYRSGLRANGGRMEFTKSFRVVLDL